MRWLILDESKKEDQHNLVNQEIFEALPKIGAQGGMVGLYESGKLVSPEVILHDVRQFNPHIILWNGPEALRYFRALVSHPCHMVNLWFDDPLMRIESAGLTEQVKESNLNVTHFVWDGYWRKRAKDMWNLDVAPIHLAASPKTFFQAETIYHPKDIVFIGNLHSPRKIQQNIEWLPPVMQSLAREAESTIRNWRDDLKIPSWDAMLHPLEASRSEGERRLLSMQGERSAEAVGALRWIVWAIAKNEVRIRMLKKALKVGTVRMFMETKQLSHACELELRGMLDAWGSNLIVHDTSGIDMNGLGEIYHHGAIHIQATDPQSVEGGIPIRVFQTAASGRPLLTDTRPELSQCFEYGKEILTYDREDQFEAALELALKDKKELEAVGRAARTRFDAEHTWAHRVATIERLAKGETQVQDLTFDKRV